METLTRADLREELIDVKGYVGERVGRVEQRLDTMNGRLLKHDRELADNAARREALERELRDLKDNWTVTTDDLMPVPDDDKPAVTKRDLKIAVAVITGLGTVIAAAHKVFDILGHYIALSWK